MAPKQGLIIFEADFKYSNKTFFQKGLNMNNAASEKAVSKKIFLNCEEIASIQLFKNSLEEIFGDALILVNDFLDADFVIIDDYRMALKASKAPRIRFIYIMNQEEKADPGLPPNVASYYFGDFTKEAKTILI
jgi:hypothetical protein